MFNYPFSIHHSLVHIRELGAGETDAYDRWVRSHPRGTLWQSSGWKRFQESLARRVRLYVVERERQIVASALVAIDRTRGGYAVWDVPRGPLWSDAAAIPLLLARLREDAYRDKGVALYVSPLEPLPSSPFPLRRSARYEQPEASIVVDLTGTEEEILKRMHPKARYNIKVAERHGVTVEQSADAGTFHALMAQTAGRDGFVPASKKHYFHFLQTVPGSFLLLAYKEHAPVGGLIGVADGDAGIYYYGASSYEHRSAMAPYLLQWEAMKRCKAEGCTRYDLLGVAPPNAPKHHPWTGISAFKGKFGRQLILYPPERMYMVRPVHYGALWLKRKFLG